MYREYVPSGEPAIVCTWTRSHSARDTALIVPDGYADLVWYSDGGLDVSGPDTEAWTAAIRRDVETVGVRLRPGSAATVLGVPLTELRDQRVPVEALGSRWVRARDVLTRYSHVDPNTRRTLLADEVATLSGPAQGIVRAATGLFATSADMTVARAADRLGISERHLRRLFVHEVGYGPKTYARVARFQRFATSDVRRALADVAIDAGYANQSHLNAEVRAITGMSPVRFLKDR